MANGNEKCVTVRESSRCFVYKVYIPTMNWDYILSRSQVDLKN